MNERSLRVIVACGPSLRAWEVECVRHLMSVRGAEIEGVITVVARSTRQASWTERSFLRFQDEGVGPLGKPASSLGELGLARLTDPTRADVILLLGDADPPSGYHGHIWCFRHSDDRSTARFLPAVREAINGERLASFELIDKAADRVLGRCVAPTAGSDPLELASTMLQTASLWPSAALRAKVASGEPPDLGPSERLEPAPTPGPVKMLLVRLKRRLTNPESTAATPSGSYNVGILHQPIHVLLEEDGSRNVRWLPTPSKGKSRMEPFGYLGKDGELNALFRKCDEDGGNASIARVRPKPDNILKRSRIMLDAGNGDGYPFTLLIDGEVRVLIANLRDRSVRLDRVNAMNDGFDAGPLLLRESLHAPTLFRHDGLWWLLGTSGLMPDALLRVWHAEHFEGPFSEHVNGPIKCDVRSSRPAGTPFVHDGQLYRPALDASRPDRPAVVINRVLKLSKEAFQEEVVQRIEGFNASAYGAGVRTISAMGDITLVDGLRSAVVSAQKANASRSKRMKTNDA